MNINYLYYFQTVCKYKNMTKAAESIHISQPSITLAIKELEKELGFELFYRIGNKIELTPEGKIFLDKSKHFIKQFEDFQCDALDLGKKRKASLKIGIPTVLGTFLLSKILPRFNVIYPDIELKIFEVPTFVGAKMIEESTLDFCIGIIDSDIYDDIDSKTIYKTELYLVTNPKNELAKHPIISNYMLKNVPFVILSEGSYHYKIIRLAKPNKTLKSTFYHTLFTRNDLASTILYKEIFQNTENLCSIPLERAITANIGVLWRRNQYISHSMKLFIEYMASIHIN
ncbi:bacterial regulatory helix-turn-helix, lysR family protein [Clostridioides difficile DA00165]|nr:bacterial regulatory helix-turn-helix, lysR family protein [Clostridioides difficile DA00165]